MSGKTSVSNGIQTSDDMLVKFDTKIITGTSPAAATMDVAHGLTWTDILSIQVLFFPSGGTFYVEDGGTAPAAADAYAVTLTATNVSLTGIGANLQSQPYSICIKYKV